REHEDDVDVWMANQFIDRSDDMPDTEGVRSRLRRVATLAVDSRHFILRHKAEHANGAVQSPVSDADQANTDDRVVGRGGTAVGYRRGGGHGWSLLVEVIIGCSCLVDN